MTCFLSEQDTLENPGRGWRGNGSQAKIRSHHDSVRKILDACFGINVEKYLSITQTTSGKKIFGICVEEKI